MHPAVAGCSCSRAARSDYHAVRSSSTCCAAKGPDGSSLLRGAACPQVAHVEHYQPAGFFGCHALHDGRVADAGEGGVEELVFGEGLDLLRAQVGRGGVVAFNYGTAAGGLCRETTRQCTSALGCLANWLATRQNLANFLARGSGQPVRGACP